MFALILLSLVAVAASWWWIEKAVNARVEHGSADRVIAIEQGTGTQAIIRQLSDAGIVQSPLALKIYLYVTGRSGRLKAGDYRFSSPISALEAIEKIERGEVTFERVTIPEGFNRFEIAERLAGETHKAEAKEFRLFDTCRKRTHILWCQFVANLWYPSTSITSLLKK